MEDLETRRNKAVKIARNYVIPLGVAVGITPAPLSSLTQLAVTPADIKMCLDIWDVYIEEELSVKDLLGLWSQVSGVTVTSAGAAKFKVTIASYIVSKIAAAIATDFAWGIGSVLTITVNGVFAWLWISYCEKVYEEKRLSSQKSYI